MFDEATQAFLRSGCALIVGSVSDEGQPVASRAWGVPELDAERRLITVLVDTGDQAALDNLRPDAPVAVTFTDVRTLRSIQVKGAVAGSHPADARDGEVVRAYCDAFFGDVETVDGTHREVLERMVPEGWCRCVVRVEEQFDQTPGPRAGATLDAAR